MPKPRPIASLDELWTWPKKAPSTWFCSWWLLRSSHSLQVVKDRLVDDSMVDGSQTRYTANSWKRASMPRPLSDGPSGSNDET